MSKRNSDSQSSSLMAKGVWNSSSRVTLDNLGQKLLIFYEKIDPDAPRSEFYKVSL